MILRSVVLLLLASLVADSADAADVKHVVLVSVDGLAARYLNGPRELMPNLKAIAEQGAVAEGMVTSFPSVTWPSHVSLITGSHPGRHGVVGNTSWNRDTGRHVAYVGDPVLTKDEAIRVPTLYDVAHHAGLSTASVIWPCSNGATTLDWIIPDSNKPQLHARYTTPGFVEELADANIDISKLGEWGWGKQHSTKRDIAYTQVALHLLREHQVNLILVHLITPDGVEHAYGPDTPEAWKAVSESDQRLNEIWQALQQPPFAGQSTMFVVSDHGFAPYEKRIHINTVLRQLDLINVDDDGKVVGRTVWCVEQGGSAFIYILDDDRRAELVKQLTRKLANVEGVDRVLPPTEFIPLGVADPSQNPEGPDLVLTTGPGYSYGRNVTGPVIEDMGSLKGTHGHDPRPDYMHATFVAAGAGIRPGTKLETVRNIDVAPTIAHLLGVQMDADGRVLTEILEPAQTVKTTIAYREVDGHRIMADVYRPDDDTVRPVIVWIHGGALIMGNRDRVPPQIRQLAEEQGYAVVSIDYRLAPETKLPEIISDVEAAFEWLADKGAARFHLDPQRMVVSGSSAGGYLTLVTGYRATPQPKALVPFWGYGDLTGSWYSEPSPHPRHNQQKVTVEEAAQQTDGSIISNARDRKGNGGMIYLHSRQNGQWLRSGRRCGKHCSI